MKQKMSIAGILLLAALGNCKNVNISTEFISVSEKSDTDEIYKLVITRKKKLL